MGDEVVSGCLALISCLAKILVAVVILSVFATILIVISCILYYIAAGIVSFTFSKTIDKTKNK
ncbi:hypothetical protein SP119_0532 [Streptococcus pyogenes]|uniref:Uncharacterized protein n=1 Tax=Streptococcus pyogenes TaxID=1314 RepID=A0ABD7UT22_STRPY|nr:hypothetical protein SP119_0532 [Streptococcus pyogenes]